MWKWSKSLNFCWKLKKMQSPKMTFRSQIGLSIKSYECFMFLQNFRLEFSLDWWILERPFFFLSETEKGKSLRNWSKSINFCWETQNMQPLKMTFRSQLEPSIKSYECFMFSQNFRFGNHTGLMDSWKTLIVFVSFKNLESMHSIIKKSYDFFVKFIKKSLNFC